MSRDGGRAALVEAALAVRSACGGVRTADGALVVARSDLAGLPQAWAAPVDGWPWRLADTDRVRALLAHPGRGDVVVAGVDRAGDERDQLHELGVPGGAARQLTDRPDAVHAAGAFAADGQAVLAASNRRDGVDFDLWRVPLDGSDPVMLAELAGWNRVADVTAGGLVVVVHAETPMDTEIWLVHPERGVITERVGDNVAARHLPGACLPDGRLLLRSDRAGDVLQAGTWDGAWHPVTERDRDCDGLAARDGLAALTVNDAGRSRLRLAPADALASAVEIPLPVGVAEDLHVPVGGDACLFTFSGPRHAANVWQAATTSHRAEPVTAVPTGGWDLSRQPQPVEHHVASSDGLRIPVSLWRPPQAARPPVVVWLHGGPESQARPKFDPQRALLLAAGYAVAEPNVRGSTGYGRRYAALDDRAGRHGAIADAVAVGDWLADRDDVDGARLAVGGASYGGYLTLCALAAAPHRWAAGIDVVGIADLATFLAGTSPERRALREAEYGSLGHDRQVLADLSPLHRAEQIAAPLLVVHGARDPRVPLAEADQIVDVLRGRNRPFERLVFDDEGHGVARVANQRTLLQRLLAFLDAHLSG